MSENERDYIQSIERGFAVLTAFDSGRPNPTLAELANATGLAKPVIRRILLTLQRLGYVTGTGPRWTLTPRVLSIAQHYSATHALLELAMPHLLAVAEQLQESASLGVLDGAEVVYAARVPVRRIMSINVAVGTRVPAYATSMGRALLAWAPRPIVDKAIELTEFRPLTATTITNARELETELARVREKGYAITSEELEKGLISIAAPVRDHSGEVVAVIACSTSTGRTTAEEFERSASACVSAAAEDLSRTLGWMP
ncbi:helix-turn-helix domain-containing protein [Nocardia cyriacigeorgica]|uniref:IclR family transcriptional regulator domain-containing protein n=1 Tax=Nocardia cyriacigeorgica TaxID=135487 RepID=UPI001896290D|nr:IclR family transcriptional regulator C-terminal domain-containing protein [Nocardia cyriacigeorgica]MBF6397474.1 helix-turn-helix domain-containing protein [Nocardia cyriacigeorgica]MBF6402868.1 helix-turn-helix domain-containing protein [Nocardia cyriacigeorgica]